MAKAINKSSKTSKISNTPSNNGPRPSTIRPGLLVSLKTSIRGNISYRKRDIERDHAVRKDGKAEVRQAKWETERTIADAAEHERAAKIRTEAWYAVARVCSNTAFGYLCPDDRTEELAEAMVKARKMIDDFNASAKITRLSIYMITGRVAPDDVEAVRAIGSELRDLMKAMSDGVKDLDASKVREAAVRAKQIASMLSDNSKLRVEVAIAAARKTATEINKAVKAGEQAALEVDRSTLKTIETARTSFLDFDEEAPAPTAKIKAKARVLDLSPEEA